MREVPLTKGKVAIVDDADYDLVIGYRWYALHCSKKKDKWAAASTIRRNGKSVSIYMHRLITGAPAGMEVDHRDNDGLNNRRSNLRVCTHQQNSFNRIWGGQKTSPFIGVSLSSSRATCPSPWRATIVIDGKQKVLGNHKTQESAARAYDLAAVRHFGDFAITNFPKEQYAEVPTA